MKWNKFILFSAILLAVMLTTSCRKEEVKYVNAIDEQQPSITGQTASDHSFTATYAPIMLGDQLVSSEWVSGDYIKLYNTSQGKDYTFTASTNGSSSTFTGSSLLSSGDLFVAFFPARMVDNITDQYSMSLPYIVTQSGATVDESMLKATNYMVASGVVTQNNNLNLSFHRLPSLVSFTLNNRSEEASFQLDSLLLTSSNAIFPKSLTYDKDGNITSFSSEKENSFKVALDGQTLAVGENVRIVSNFMPTTNGSVSLLSGNEHVSLILKTHLNGEAQDFTLYQGALSGLQLSGFADSQYNFFSGRDYSYSYDLHYSEVPEEGYRVKEVDGTKTVTIFNAMGLRGFAHALNADGADEALKSATVMLHKSVKDKTFDMSSEHWTPIKEFKGTFDAEGLVLDHLTVDATSDGKAAFIVNSKGSISNLTIRNAMINANSAAVFAVEVSDGSYTNCKVEGTTTINSSDGDLIGGFVGKMTKGMIKDCSVDGVTITSTAGKQGAGGFIGRLEGNAIIKGCHSGSNVSVNVSTLTGSNVGGFVGFVGTGKDNDTPIVACYTTSSVSADAGAGFIGGFAGQFGSWTHGITGCYSAGSLHIKSGVDGSSCGGFLGGYWVGANQTRVNFKGIYVNTTMTIDRNSSTIGSVQGKINGAGSQSVETVFYTGSQNPVGSKAFSGTAPVKVDATAIANKITELNAKLDGTEYTFTTDGSTASEPLKLKKK